MFKGLQVKSVAHSCACWIYIPFMMFSGLPCGNLTWQHDMINPGGWMHLCCKDPTILLRQSWVKVMWILILALFESPRGWTRIFSTSKNHVKFAENHRKSKWLEDVSHSPEWSGREPEDDGLGGQKVDRECEENTWTKILVNRKKREFIVFRTLERFSPATKNNYFLHPIFQTDGPIISIIPMAVAQKIVETPVLV